MNRLIISVCVAMAFSLCLAAVSFAHKVNIFAYVDGDSVVTDSGYSRSRRVQDGTVEVYDAGSGKMLLSGTTDKTGQFAFQIPAEARTSGSDLRLLLKAGEGHQAEWVVKNSEFAGEGAEPAPVVVAASDATVDVEDVAAPVKGAVDIADVEAVVRRELAPVKHLLADLSQPGPSVTEIVGGIGYILGLFGIVAYMKSRKSS
ncbi:hypothetical protein [uncultured Pseudodesulfovibrio sp.]|uniref:hypothetical protein n=1 Tax=uncultured Pseudodesulfovibrio sp. TaxID=2035858 RepID=UPI0029C6682F|nr:hypothetical protein [uncultured Pseudodesulfovibrio sp.]